MTQRVTDPRCGQTWVQHGNRTGHCAQCHRTFEGLSLFDWHQVLGDDGRVICRDPAEPKGVSKGLRLVDGSWRGPGWDAAVFKQKTEADQ